MDPIIRTLTRSGNKGEDEEVEEMGEEEKGFRQLALELLEERGVVEFFRRASFARLEHHDSMCPTTKGKW